MKFLRLAWSWGGIAAMAVGITMGGGLCTLATAAGLGQR
jgi:hypothetical protein